MASGDAPGSAGPDTPTTPRTSRKELKNELARMKVALEASRQEIEKLRTKVSDRPLSDMTNKEDLISRYLLCMKKLQFSL